MNIERQHQLFGAENELVTSGFTVEAYGEIIRGVTNKIPVGVHAPQILYAIAVSHRLFTGRNDIKGIEFESKTARGRIRVLIDDMPYGAFDFRCFNGGQWARLSPNLLLLHPRNRVEIEFSLDDVSGVTFTDYELELSFLVSQAQPIAPARIVEAK